MNLNSLKLFRKRCRSLSSYGGESCWLWDGALSIDGYGHYKVFGRRFLAHRLSYQVFRKLLNDNQCVLHKCDVPRCVNPKHLFLGNRDINNKDRALKGRSAVGERAGKAKLTNLKVKKIRKLYRSRKFTTRQLGRRFGVSNHQISMIVRKLSWRHL